jgi:hypothetical protein
MHISGSLSEKEWFMVVILGLKRLRSEESWFETSLSK